MKRTIVIIAILLMAAAVSFAYIGAENHIKKLNHPLEFCEYVELYSQEYSVPQNIIYAVIKTESGFESDALSNKGAIGLMQITPDTFNWLLTKNPQNDVNVDSLYKPETNIKYGTYFLSLLYSEFGTWENAFAAYNAGRSRVNDWLADENYSTDGRLTNIPYKETRDYVKKVSEACEIYSELYFENRNK